MASLFNIDPYAYLSAPENDRLVLDHVIVQAAEMRQERDQAFLKNLQIVVQNGVAKAFKGS